ncbi:MAG: ECF transporter S component [Candidatus Nanopelagicales bacterium]
MRQVHAAPLRWRTVAALVGVSAVGLLAFFWPFVVTPTSVAADHASDAPWFFALLLPLVVAVLLAEVSGGAMDAKGIAMLAVLAAVATAVRPLGAGVAGLEPMFVVLLLGGRALGPAFGFALGSLAMFTSALLTAGVGPWLPFQMVAAGWFAMGAGLLPQLRGKVEIAMLVAYGAAASLAYGFLMNLSFWPWALGENSSLSFVAGAPVSENLARWFTFNIATSLGWDVPRAVLTAVLTVLAGPVLLRAVRRATRRAAFDVPVRFQDADTARPEGRSPAPTTPAVGA